MAATALPRAETNSRSIRADREDVRRERHGRDPPVLPRRVGEGRVLVEAVPEADAAQADFVGDHLDMLSVGLHAHHEGEDTLLWDPLEQRAPSCAAHVERMKQQHAALLVHLTAMDEALPAWRERHVDGCRRRARRPRWRERRARRAPPRRGGEHRACHGDGDHPARGRRALGARSQGDPKGKMFVQLGAILAAQPDGGDEWLHAPAGAGARDLALIGKPKYEAHRAALIKS